MKKDMHGNLIQFGSETKRKFQRYRKYTCNDYIAYRKDNRICVENQTNALEYILVEVIAEDPTELVMCYNPDEDQKNGRVAAYVEKSGKPGACLRIPAGRRSGVGSRGRVFRVGGHGEGVCGDL